MGIPQKSYFLPLVLYVVSASLIIFALIQKNSNFMDVRAIIRKHLSVFRGSPLQRFVLFIVPFFLAVASVVIKPVNESIINNLNVVLAILVSMFFAMLSILSSFPTKLNSELEERPGEKRTDELYVKILGESFNSVLFECILCILTLVCSFSVLFFGYYEQGIILTVISVILYYLFFVMVLNSFVIIKRIMALFNHLQRTKDQ